MRLALAAQGLCFSAAALVTALLVPAEGVAAFRRSHGGWPLLGLLLSSLALLAAPRWLSLHALFTAALSVVVARGAAQLMCAPLVRAVWFSASPLVLLGDDCSKDHAGRVVVVIFAIVWALALVLPQRYAAAALGTWALVGLNAYAWDWRAVYALLGVVALSAYVDAQLTRLPPQQALADTLAAMWLPLPRALWRTAAAALGPLEDEDEEEEETDAEPPPPHKKQDCPLQTQTQHAAFLGRSFLLLQAKAPR